MTRNGDGGNENFKSIAGLLEGSPTWVERNSVGEVTKIFERFQIRKS